MANICAFVCVLIVAVDIAAGVLSIEAEIAKDEVTHKRLKDFKCEEPNDRAFKLGLAASTLLGLSHIIENLVGGCMCLCFTEELERSSSSRQLWFACIIVSWIVVAIGFPLLVMGMLENSKLKGSCRILHHHFLFIGGITCFVHGLLSAAFYVSASVSFLNGRIQGSQERQQP
ncbi:hypothetical protein SLEP1_g52815 [Rubroshorea leprosula]|uniref:Uncharacterized protein n=1 Tax=Rubroshorea leprosula TaxID=152421 RepID=A0AAV5MA57_9ROSI|nr:hypothetical protein SLEP1_g52815 [Rubroshorea leprosula]